MKKKITYEIFGQVERCSYFRLGKIMYRVDFTGGFINSAGIVPARYVTDNPLLQKAIEDSEAFRSGQIKRGKVEIIAGDEAAKSAPAGTNKKSFPEVANMQQARALLMAAPFKIPLSELQSKQAIRAKADEKGISFPNWL